ncbi:MAG: hypothetical protein KJO07_07160 [Deltaproteobacteria bacterium]|nr:hypothetical protein [Deltaproteobacteria bacterium]
MKRSPLLGYNHNISHRGLVFHVQTEDSGVDHPHIFTHLFYGGVVLNTRKLDYDPESAEESVKALMQSQHKSILKLLKRGDFDAKITQYFGDNPDLQPARGDAAEAAKSPPAEQPAGQEDEVSDVSAAFEAIQEEETRPSEAPQMPEPSAPEPEPAAPQPIAPAASTSIYSRTKPGQAERISSPRIAAPSVVHDQPTMPVQRARPAAARPTGKARTLADRRGEAGRRSAPSVVVSRPAVIIGAPSKVVGARAGAAPARPRPRRFAREETAGQGLFGKDTISEKSLDEVILAYLSEDSAEE